MHVWIFVEFSVRRRFMVVISNCVRAALADPITRRVWVQKRVAEKTIISFNVFLMPECRCAERIARVTIAFKNT